MKSSLISRIIAPIAIGLAGLSCGRSNPVENLNVPTNEPSPIPLTMLKGYNCAGLAIGDMNGDQKNDIIILTQGRDVNGVLTNHRAYVLLNNGDGSYSFQNSTMKAEKENTK